MSRGVTGSVEIAHGHDPYGLAGLRVSEAIARLGGKRDALTGRGYRVREGIVHRIKTVTEIEDEISARSETPSPCFRCGCRVCSCGGRG